MSPLPHRRLRVHRGSGVAWGGRPARLVRPPRCGLGRRYHAGGRRDACSDGAGPRRSGRDVGGDGERTRAAEATSGSPRERGPQLRGMGTVSACGAVRPMGPGRFSGASGSDSRGVRRSPLPIPATERLPAPTIRAPRHRGRCRRLSGARGLRPWLSLSCASRPFAPNSPGRAGRRSGPHGATAPPRPRGAG